MKSCPKCKTSHDKSGAYCSRSCANSRLWSDLDKLKKSASAKLSEKVKAMLDSKKGKLRAPRVSTRCLLCGDPIYHKKSSSRKYHRECWLRASGGYRANSTIKHKSIYGGFQMDSGAEKAFAILLDENKIRWVKNTTKSFKYVDQQNKVRRYYPDFYLPDLSLWVEVKGRFYAKKDNCLQLKLNAVDAIRLVYSDEIRNCNGDVYSLIKHP